jgi:hypothetical protein
METQIHDIPIQLVDRCQCIGTYQLTLLPIREAYEWKHGILIVHGKDRKILASNS